MSKADGQWLFVHRRRMLETAARMRDDSAADAGGGEVEAVRTKLTGQGNLIVLLLLAIFGLIPPAQAQTGDRLTVPEFRHVNKTDISSSLRRVRRIRFAIRDDNPPFSFRTSSGALSGFMPLLMDELCRQIKASCEFLPRPSEFFDDALNVGEVDAAMHIVGTLPPGLDQYDYTRPFLRSFSRFATRIASPIDGVDRRSLAGKRIGVVAGTRQAAFVARNFPRSAIIEFKTRIELYDALRLARVDALFEDAFRAMFWLQGENARGCCKFLGAGFGVGTNLQQNFTFKVRKRDADLRKVLDYGLDRLQTTGKFAELYAKFFPASPH